MRTGRAVLGIAALLLAACEREQRDFGGDAAASSPNEQIALSTIAPGGAPPQVELTGRGKQYDSNNQNEYRRAFGLVNANLGYTRGAWTFSVWVRNAFDRRYEKRVYFFGNEDPDYIPTRYEDRADPRQLGASAAWRF